MKATMHATDARLNLPCLCGNSSTNLVFLVCELGVWFCSRFKTTLFLRVHCSDEVQDAFKTPSVFERMIRILRYNKILEIGHVQVGAGRGSLINYTSALLFLQTLFFKQKKSFIISCWCTSTIIMTWTKFQSRFCSSFYSTRPDCTLKI